MLQIPVKEGDQVIESNNFNAGTTIASVADLTKMIFEGQVDETEVSKLAEGSEIKVILGALEKDEFGAKLTFVAPKGIEQGGAVQFKIKADVEIPESVNVRAGYSANAIMSIGQKENILCINESLLQFNRITDKPFVEILNEDGSFVTKEVEVLMDAVPQVEEECQESIREARAAAKTDTNRIKSRLDLYILQPLLFSTTRP